MKAKKEPRRLVKKPVRNYSDFEGAPISPEEAARIVAQGELMTYGSAAQRAKGAALIENGKPALELNDPAIIVTGGEMVVDAVGRGTQFLLDTTGNPDQIAAAASRDRLNLTGDNLALALDASESIRGANSLEKMLAHQMAAAHRMAMELMNQVAANDVADDVVKLVNASTRLMSTFQNGLQTLAKVRTGGKQEVTVQHIHVAGDAQAVVAGKMDYPAGGRGHGGGQDGK